MNPLKSVRLHKEMYPPGLTERQTKQYDVGKNGVTSIGLFDAGHVVISRGDKSLLVGCASWEFAEPLVKEATQPSGKPAQSAAARA